MNKYKVFWDQKSIILEAPTSYEACVNAAKEFQSNTRKLVKSWEVSAVLVEKDGQPITHTGGELP